MPILRPVRTPVPLRAGLPWKDERGGLGKPLLRFASGTFTRASEGSYLTSPSAFAWAVANEPRYEDWRGSDGRLLKLEGAATNVLVANPADVTTATGGWAAVAGGTAPGAHSTITAPDGSPAFQVTFGASAADGIQDALGAPTLAGSTRYCGSCWVRTITGTQDVRLVVNDGVSGFIVASGTATTTWQRIQSSGQTGASPTASDVFQIRNGTAAAAGTVLVAFPQLETGGFATSAIRTAGGTRAADSMSWAVPPAAILSGRYRFVVYPMASSVQVRAQQIVYGISTNDLHDTTAADHLRVVSGGTALVDTAAQTWSSGSRIEHKIDSTLTTGAYTYDIDGTTTVANFSAPKSWTTGTIFAGSRQAGTAPFFGCVSEVYPW